MDSFNKLWTIVNRLRDPITGCPWDLEQTPKSLVANFIEELYEVIEAIESDDSEHLKEELGDLLLHILMQVKIAEENQNFQLNDVLKAISDKLIIRHPHVFEGDNCDENKEKLESDEIKFNWERLKKVHKRRKSVLDGIPKSMPALIYAQRMQDKAASVGFDWDDINDVIKKIDEELQELKAAIKSGISFEIEDEIGDMFFSLVNLCRKKGLDSERVLKKSAAKFYERFQKIEQYHKDRDENIYESSLERLNVLWESSKKGI